MGCRKVLKRLSIENIKNLLYLRILFKNHLGEKCVHFKTKKYIFVNLRYSDALVHYANKPLFYLYLSIISILLLLLLFKVFSNVNFLTFTVLNDSARLPDHSLLAASFTWILLCHFAVW